MRELTQTESFKTGFDAVIASKLRAAFQNIKYKNDAEADRLLEQIRGKLRYQLRSALSQIGKTSKEFALRKGGPGRKPKFKETERRALLALINTYIMNGMTPRAAIEQTFRSWNDGKEKRKQVSTRTLWRVWKDRGINKIAQEG
jgi:hypothetical protein